MICVRMMKSSLDKIVLVITMRDKRMSAVGAVGVAQFMR